MQLKSLIAAIVAIAPCWLVSRAFGETFEAGLGLESITVASSSYQAASSSSIQADATYAKPLFGRWSVTAQYQINLKGTFSGGIGGISFDSEELETKRGSGPQNGEAEITKVPIWVYRANVGFGIFKYVDILQSTNAALGSRNAVPVQADLYGLKITGEVLRFWGEHSGALAGFSYTVASAQNFGISSNCLILGGIYRTE